MGVRTMISAAAASVAVCASAGADPTVRFAVFGDLQDESPAGHAADLALADAINAAAPDLSIFIGDIQGGGVCEDRHREEAAAVFARVDGPVVVTFGDNEWTDCALPGKGDFDPFERLARLREAFAPDGLSLGGAPMPLDRQAGPTPENALWSQGGVVFVAVHAPGSNNGLYPDRPAFEEFEARNAANLAWLDAAFARVTAEEAIGLVVAFHANPLWDAPPWQADAYRDLKATLIEADTLGVPVLAVHGDTHTYRVDKPLVVWGEPGRADHLTRVEVFGPPERGFVLIEADPDAPELWRVTAVETSGAAR